jgi:hypothetical protein
MNCNTCNTPILPGQVKVGIGTSEADQTLAHGYQLTCIAALLDENAELRKDRARLDWLANGSIEALKVGSIVNGFRFDGKYYGNIRATIDAAMKEGK